MENPAVIVTNTFTKPTPESIDWAQTDEGAQLVYIVMSIIEMYNGLVEVEYENPSPTTKIVRVIYPSVELYNFVRAECLDIIPDFYEKRAAYFASIGGKDEQTVVMP